MPSGMINITQTRTAKQSVSSCEYIMRDGECLLRISNMSEDKKEILKLVGQYAAMEKIGSKGLGIRGRHDAQCMTKLIFSLPNDNLIAENERRIREFLKISGIEDYPYIAAIHRGENGDDGVINRHAHLSFFQRKFVVGDSNKNRIFVQKTFIDKLKTQYQSVFGFTANTKEQKRDRIDRRNWKTIKAEAVAENSAIENVPFSVGDIIEKEIENLKFTYQQEMLVYNAEVKGKIDFILSLQKQLDEQVAAAKECNDVLPITVAPETVKKDDLWISQIITAAVSIQKINNNYIQIRRAYENKEKENIKLKAMGLPQNIKIEPHYPINEVAALRNTIAYDQKPIEDIYEWDSRRERLLAGNENLPQKIENAPLNKKDELVSEIPQEVRRVRTKR